VLRQPRKPSPHPIRLREALGLVELGLQLGEGRGGQTQPLFDAAQRGALGVAGCAHAGGVLEQQAGKPRQLEAFVRAAP
jgi:hypothetical protein